jgi:hypothetical protein
MNTKHCIWVFKSSYLMENAFPFFSYFHVTCQWTFVLCSNAGWRLYFALLSCKTYSSTFRKCSTLCLRKGNFYAFYGQLIWARSNNYSVLAQIIFIPLRRFTSLIVYFCVLIFREMVLLPEKERE